VVRSIAKEIGDRRRDWDDPLSLPESTVSAITRGTAILLSVPPQKLQKATPSVHIWSDASDRAVAYLLQQQQQLIDGRLWEMDIQIHIFFKELFALCSAIERSFQLGHDCVSASCDNMAVVLCFQKGHSSNKAANGALSRTFSLIPWTQIDVRWVPSASQLADAFTRGATLPQFPCHIHAVMRASLFKTSSPVGSLQQGQSFPDFP